MLASVIAGFAVAVLVLIFAENGCHPYAKMARCSMGFLVSMVWIMAIADEVVQVLQVRFVFFSDHRFYVHYSSWRHLATSSDFRTRLLVSLSSLLATHWRTWLPI
jgi:hypothetical protein